MTVYKIYRKRYKELYITASSSGDAYLVQQGEKLIFVIHSGSGEILRKELTSADFDAQSGKYILALTTNDTDIPAGRYFFDCALLDSDGEKHHIGSGRVVVKETYA